MEAPQRQSFSVEADRQSFVPKDVAGAARWLSAPPQFAYLVHIALLKLGPPATAHDAEETLQEFLLNSLEDVLRCYKPSEGNFWTYFLAALRNECWRQSKKLRQRTSREEIFDDGLPVGWRSYADTPVHLLEKAELRKKLELAKQELDSRASQAIDLYHMENLTVAQIAERMTLTVQHVKVLLHRGRHELAELLRWDSCSRLRTRDVTDWTAFCRRISEAGGHQHGSVPETLWSHLDSKAQQLARCVAASDTAIDPRHTSLLLRQINDLLLQPDLWPKSTLAAFRRQSQQSQEAMRLLRKRRRGSISTLRLNRLVLLRKVMSTCSG